MKKLTLGVIGTSRKEDEKRVPIHPDHLSRIPKDIRKQLVFEKGYGVPFDLDDDFLFLKLEELLLVTNYWLI